MNRTTSIAMFGAVIIAVAAIGVSGLDVTGIPSSSDKIADDSKMLGHLTLVAKDEQGNIKSYQQTDNLIVNSGDNCIMTLAIATSSCTSQGKFTVMGVGTGTTAPDIGNTGLGTEVTNPARGAATIATSTATGTGATQTNGATATLTTTFNPTTTVTVSEAGIFDTTSTSTYNMLARQTFAGITLNSGDSLTVTWSVKIA